MVSLLLCKKTVLIFQEAKQTPQLPSITTAAAGDLSQYSEKAGKGIIAKTSDPWTKARDGQALV